MYISNKDELLCESLLYNAIYDAQRDMDALERKQVVAILCETDSNTYPFMICIDIPSIEQIFGTMNTLLQYLSTVDTRQHYMPCQTMVENKNVTHITVKSHLRVTHIKK